jgi:hypothetical protein
MGMKLIPTVSLFAVLHVVFTLASAAEIGPIMEISTPGPVQIFDPVITDLDLNDADEAKIDRRPTISTTFVTLNSRGIGQAFDLSRPTPYQIKIRFTAEIVLDIVVRSTEDLGDGTIRVGGSVSSERLSAVSMVITSSHAVGSMQVGPRGFEFIQLANAITAVVELDQRRYPPERNPGAAHRLDEFDMYDHPDFSETEAADDGLEMPEPIDGILYEVVDYAPPEIRVLVVASESQFDCDATWIENMGNAYAGDLNLVFDGYATSRVTFVCIAMSDAWSNIEDAHLELRTSAVVASERKNAEADIVVLLLPDDDDYCGYTVGPDYPDHTIDSSPGFYAEHGAFSVVSEKCALYRKSFAHEIGHVFGMKHERFSEQGGVSNFCGYGYPIMLGCKPVARTIMAYDGYCKLVNGSTCFRAPTYSIPGDSSYVSIGSFFGGGLVKGQSCTSTEGGHLGAPANNTKQLVDTASDVAGYSDHILTL